MTPIQQKIFGYIALRRIEGKPVTLRGIQREFGFRSPFSVLKQLRRLKELGKVTWEPTCANTLVTTYKFIPADQLDSSPV